MRKAPKGASATLLGPDDLRIVTALKERVLAELPPLNSAQSHLLAAMLVLEIGIGLSCRNGIDEEAMMEGVRRFIEVTRMNAIEGLSHVQVTMVRAS